MSILWIWVQNGVSRAISFSFFFSAFVGKPLRSHSAYFGCSKTLFTIFSQGLNKELVSTPGELFLLPMKKRKLFIFINEVWAQPMRTFSLIFTLTLVVFHTLWLPFGANRTRCQRTCINLTWFYTVQWWHGAFIEVSTHWSGVYASIQIISLADRLRCVAISPLLIMMFLPGKSKLLCKCPPNVQMSSTDSQKSHHTHKMKWM